MGRPGLRIGTTRLPIVIGVTLIALLGLWSQSQVAGTEVKVLVDGETVFAGPVESSDTSSSSAQTSQGSTASASAEASTTDTATNDQVSATASAASPSSNSSSTNISIQSTSSDPNELSLDAQSTTSRSGERQVDVRVNGQTVPVGQIESDDDISIDVRNEGTLDGSSHKTDVRIDRDISVQARTNNDLDEDIDEDVEAGNNDIKDTKDQDVGDVKHGTVKIDLNFNR